MLNNAKYVRVNPSHIHKKIVHLYAIIHKRKNHNKMKQKIFEGLKEKYPEIQDSVLNRIAEKQAKTVKTEDEVDAAVEGVTLQQIIDSYADSRVTEATATAVANYEKKHGLKEGKPAKQDEPEPDPKKGQKKPEGGDDEPAWAKALRESNEALQQKLAAIEGEKAITTRTKKLTAAFDEMGVPQALRSTYEKGLSKMAFETDEEYDTYISEIKAELQPIIAEMKQKKVILERPLGGGDPNPKPQVPPEVQARIDERKTEVAPPPIKGMPATAKV